MLRLALEMDDLLMQVSSSSSQFTSHPKKSHSRIKGQAGRQVRMHSSSSSLIRTTLLQSVMVMKKKKQKQRPKTTTAPPPPFSPPLSPPPTPQNIQPRSSYCNNNKFNSLTSSFKKTKRNLTLSISETTTLTSAAVVPKQQQNHQKSLSTLDWDWDWKPLNLGRSELFLPLTFPTGQTFRWKQLTGLHHHYTGVVASHLVSLKQLNNGFGDVSYCIHGTTTDQDKEALDALGDYLNVGISLKDMWETFSASDSRFSELAMHLGGARVLRQDPFECLIQFLCSSNNNIGRITKMVDFISSLGDYLGTVQGFKFHVFPSLERLSLVSEEELRAAGFGYRAKYIVGTVKALLLKPGGGAEWLASLRGLDLHDAVEALCSLPGVGPKVAACVALFSLDQHHAVPVDTHVWQIATRYLIPELAGARLTPKLCSRVADAFVSKYGKYAGWAQTLLFIAELPSQKAHLEMQSSLKKNRESDPDS